MKTSWKREGWVAAAGAALWTLLWASGALTLVEDPGGDLLLRLPRPAAGTAEDVAAVVIGDEDVAALGPLPWPRQRTARLIETVRALGARGVVVDVLLADAGDEDGDAALAQALDGGDVVLAAALRGPDAWVLPLKRFGGAHRAAHVHGESGADGVVRAVAASKQGAGLSLPALSIAAARLAGHAGSYEPGELIRPDFRYRPREIPRLEARTLLAGEADPETLRGRVVFLGVTAAGASDQLVVASSRRPVPGVLLHASVTESILRGALLTPLPVWAVFLAVFFPAWTLQRLRTRSGRLRLGRFAAVAAAVVLVAPAALWTWGLLLPWVTMLLGLVSSALLREAVESRDAKRQAAVALGERRRMAHELKTPLASVAGFGEMLERYELDQEELRRVAGLIRGESERLGELVAAFLDLERLTTDRFDAERRQVDLAALAGKRRQVLLAAANGHEIRLHAGRPATVSGDEELLARLFDNLVGNALKHARTDVDVTVRREGGHVVLEVSDQGPGIPPDAVPHLFERFYRVPGSTAPGSGLGLAWVKEIAAWHGGCVSVESRAGEGTTFSVTLPRFSGAQGNEP